MTGGTLPASLLQRAALIGAGLALGGCAALPGGGMTAYRCAEGHGFHGRFSSDSAAVRLERSRSTLDLKRVPSASGSKYSDGHTTIWIKGGQAYVERGGQPLYVGCAAARS